MGFKDIELSTINQEQPVFKMDAVPFFKPSEAKKKNSPKKA